MDAGYILLGTAALEQNLFENPHTDINGDGVTEFLPVGT